MTQHLDRSFLFSHFFEGGGGGCQALRAEVVGLEPENAQGQLGSFHGTPQLLMGQGKVGEGSQGIAGTGIDSFDCLREKLHSFLGAPGGEAETTEIHQSATVPGMGLQGFAEPALSFLATVLQEHGQAHQIGDVGMALTLLDQSREPAFHIGSGIGAETFPKRAELLLKGRDSGGGGLLGRRLGTGRRKGCLGRRSRNSRHPAQGAQAHVGLPIDRGGQVACSLLAEQLGVGEASLRLLEKLGGILGRRCRGRDAVRSRQGRGAGSAGGAGGFDRSAQQTDQRSTHTGTVAGTGKML